MSYLGEKHGFTNPAAAEHSMAERGCDANADKQSWQEMLDLFRQVFG